MDVQIARNHQVLTASIAAGVRTSGAFDVRGLAGALLHFGSTYVGGTAAFRAATALAGTYRPLYDNAGAAVSLPAGASRSIHLPDAVVCAGWFKVFAATKQTGTAGAAALAITGKS